MKKLSFFGLALVIFTACENRAGNQVVPPPSQNPVNVQQPVSQPANNASINNQPAQPVNGSVALNPKHGQPGHRCDIPEGAPLNSAPTTQQPLNMQQPTPSNPVIAQPVINQPTPSGSVKLNPPHGQPGHDCTIAVGQPLRS